MSALSKFGRAVGFGARTHDESRTIICCVCSKKVKQDKHCIKVVSEKWSDLVRKFVFSGYSIHNPLHPTALCVTCRTTLSALDKVNYTECYWKFLLKNFRIPRTLVADYHHCLTTKDCFPQHPVPEVQLTRNASAGCVRMPECL